MALFVFKFVPEYDAIVAAGGPAAAALAEQGPQAYYFAMGILGFATGALLFASSAYLLGRGMRARMRNKGESAPRALINLFRRSPAQAWRRPYAHLGVAVVLVGLVGSTMYVQEQTLNIAAEDGGSACASAVTELVFTGTREYSDSQDDRIKEVSLDVLDAGSGDKLGSVSPPWRSAR